MTLNRFCGSASAGDHAWRRWAWRAGYQDLVVAGGVESMSRWDLTTGSVDHRRRQPRLRATFPTVPQGISADLIATLEGFSRADVDDLRGARASAAPRWRIAEGRFDRGIIPVTDARGEILLATTSTPRPGTTLEGLSKLRADVCRDGCHRTTRMAFRALRTTSTTSTTCTTPATRPVSSTERRRRSWRRTRGDARGHASGRVPCHRGRRLGAGDHVDCPGPAAERCLAKAGMKTDDVDLWEINEAFAAVPLKTVRDLGPRSRAGERQRRRDRPRPSRSAPPARCSSGPSSTSSSARTSPPDS